MIEVIKNIENILSEDMALCINKKVKDISVSFIAALKPETSAKNILILNELVVDGKISKIYVMASFMYSPEKKIIFGEEAFSHIKKEIETDAIRKHDQNQLMTHLLEHGKCYEC